jgi:chromosome segregation ATPase
MDHKKYHLIQSKLEEARNALKTWNDRRAEVSIELDSMFMEIEEFKKQSQAERSELEKEVSTLKSALEKSEADYHRHFEVYTNDMQELKSSNEVLAQQLRESHAAIEVVRREMKKQEADHQSRLAKTVSDAELRNTEQQTVLKQQIVRLTGELASVSEDRKELSAKVTQYEKELRTIRGQMMSFLDLTREVSSDATVSARVIVSDDSVVEQKTEIHAADDQKKNPPATVDEYLKRFGY